MISLLLLPWFFWITYSQDIDDSVMDMEFFKYYGIVPLLLGVHKEIWMWYAESDVMNSYSSLLQNMKYYSDMDVLQYLKKSINPESSLNNFLSKTQSLLNSSNAFILYASNVKNEQVQNKTKCDTNKETVDKNFALALKDFDAAKMEKYLSSSIEDEKCSVEARIVYNAYDKMESQVKYYYNILQNKYDYFFGNKYDIIQLLKK